jgi:hypothetical protein
VAYSGEKDAQKKAADNIENALKGFPEKLRFTHIVAPGLEHQMPPEWRQKAEIEYRKYADRGREHTPERIRFVTYTPKYGVCGWVGVHALETTYERAVVDAIRKGNEYTIATRNVRRLIIDGGDDKRNTPLAVSIDGQKIDVNSLDPAALPGFALERIANKWAPISFADTARRLQAAPEKTLGFAGPIDDAFTGAFHVVRPAAPGWHPKTDGYISATVDRFAAIWDRYFRGHLPALSTGSKATERGNLILFGDPESNSLIAKVLPKLPITWTKDKLIVNGAEYDPKTHVPVLIYPNPLTENRSYVVLNSGHTFKEADLKGTNALLYPRLGDWAVIKPTPTKDDPAAYEVVAAGLFDENWQFPKK